MSKANPIPTASRQPKPGILYISYDGMLEPLGQSQVLAYLEGLSRDYRIYLISFEKKRDLAARERSEAMGTRMREGGISWIPLRYHKRPTAPATAWDIMVGICVALWVTLRRRVAIVHARSYIPALIGLIVKRLLGAKLLFDMRGFWADERVDGRLWPAEGRLYRMTKTLERRLLLAADHIVTLTHASVSEIRSFPYLHSRITPISVIPTCTDLERFSPGGRAERGAFVLGYVGSVGTWYLIDEMLAFFRLLTNRLPDARLLVVNRNEQAFIRERITSMRIDPGKTEIVSADHRDVPDRIRRMSAGMALIEPTYSKMASAPTKLAEYLACGIPCLGNERVGDMGTILSDRRVGIVLDGFSEDEMRKAVDRLIALVGEPGLAERCRATATEIFSLDQGIASYAGIYDVLSGKAVAAENEK